MAAKESVNSNQSDVEYVVNRWVVDYYLSLALELFQKQQYEDFRGIRDVLNSVIMVRPFESTDSMTTKLGVLKFLSRINEGESPELLFESDQTLSPLESAFVLLEVINQECTIPQQDLEDVRASLKEMMVVIFIKNNNFAKAKEVLNKYFPKTMVGKKAIFMELINQKSKAHEVIEQTDFQRFKVEMFAFCQKICSFNVPFLHKAAEQLIDKRLAVPDDNAAGPDGQDKAGPSTSPQINIIHKHTTRSRLEATYNALAAGSDQRTFDQLEEEVEEEVGKEEPTKKDDLSLCLSPSPVKGTNQDSEQDGLFQRNSGSPMEASPADQATQTDAVPQIQEGSLSKTPSVPRNRRLYTVAQLVVEPDSQGSSQCTAASQELEVEVRAEEPQQSPAIPNKSDLQSPVTDSEVAIPTRKRRAATSFELSTDSEEDSQDSVANGETSVKELHNRSNTSVTRKPAKQLSSDSEEDPQESVAPHKTPVQKTPKQRTSTGTSTRTSTRTSKDTGNTDVCITDSSLDSSPELFPLHTVPRTSSTPRRSCAQGKASPTSKWKQLYKNAKESKETWSDEESCVHPKKNSDSHNDSTMSTSGNRRKMWSDSETQKLKDGVKRFGEGNWSKIKAYYSFKDRTNVNLKDRWRTLKKSNMV